MISKEGEWDSAGAQWEGLSPPHAEAFARIYEAVKRVEDKSTELESLLHSTQKTSDFLRTFVVALKRDKDELKELLRSEEAKSSADLIAVIKIARGKINKDLQYVEGLIEALQLQAQDLSVMIGEASNQQGALLDLLQAANATEASRDEAQFPGGQQTSTEVLRDRVQLLERELANPASLLVRHVLHSLTKIAAVLLSGVSSSISRNLSDWADGLDPLWPSNDVADRAYDQQTAQILARYFPPHYLEPPPPLHMTVGSDRLVRRHIANARRLNATRRHPPGDRRTPAFSIITPFFRHMEFFKACARSVEEAGKGENITFEWIIVNDDPSFKNDDIMDRVPVSLRANCRLLGGSKNQGISKALDDGIRESRYEWIVLLDCDDMLEPQALVRAATSIRQHPSCRYFSSLMIDVDENGTPLRKRKEEADITDLFQFGMVAGHMMVFERSLYNELNGFNARFNGVQDFEFALRVQNTNPIMRIPEHLYRYRWHNRSQSVARAVQQLRRANAARIAFLREQVGLRPDKPKVLPISDFPETFCVIRTQGNRIDLLAEALSSIRDQKNPVTPCVVVHADLESFEFVRRHLESSKDLDTSHRPVIILHAPRTDLKRGYPCNVALDYVREHRDQFELLCFLDDDDHFLPSFSERLTDMMRLRGCAMAYGMTNALPKSGQPFVQHSLRPWSSIIDSNFITFNSFIVQTAAVLDANLRFETDMHYLEDHHFLLQLLAAGVRAEPLMEVIAEYRLLGDGNAAIKRDMTHFEECQKKISKLAKSVARSLPVVTFWDDLLAFPRDEGDPDIEIIKRAYAMFEETGTARV